MTPDQFRNALAALGLNLTQAVPVLGAGDVTTVRRWANGHRKVPGPVTQLLAALLTIKAMTGT